MQSFLEQIRMGFGLDTIRFDALIDVVGWTLLHSLWQGTVIALLIALCLKLLSGTDARLRYAAAISGFLTVIVAVAGTAILLWSQWMPQEFVPQAAAAAAPMPAIGEGPTAEPITVLQQAMPLLVVLWCAGVVLSIARLIGGWLWIERLRRTSDASARRWKPIVNDLCNQIGLHHAVRVIEASVTQVPMVVGWLSPVLVLPIGFAVGLTPAQARAILAHELAHIRRHDYLVNVVQSVFETLFFYHPAVWWLSRRIRDEREFCCDDIAVAVAGSAALYARALTDLESLRSLSPQLGLSAHGGSLMTRIRRLMQSPVPTKAPVWSALIPVAAFTGIVTIGAAAAPVSCPPEEDAKTEHVITVDDDGRIKVVRVATTKDKAKKADKTRELAVRLLQSKDKNEQVDLTRQRLVELALEEGKNGQLQIVQALRAAEAGDLKIANELLTLEKAFVLNRQAHDGATGKLLTIGDAMKLHGHSHDEQLVTGEHALKLLAEGGQNKDDKNNQQLVEVIFDALGDEGGEPHQIHAVIQLDGENLQNIDLSEIDFADLNFEALNSQGIDATILNMADLNLDCQANNVICEGDAEFVFEDGTDLWHVIGTEGEDGEHGMTFEWVVGDEECTDGDGECAPQAGVFWQTDGFANSNSHVIQIDPGRLGVVLGDHAAELGIDAASHAWVTTLSERDDIQNLHKIAPGRFAVTIPGASTGVWVQGHNNAQLPEPIQGRELRFGTTKPPVLHPRKLPSGVMNGQNQFVIVAPGGELCPPVCEEQKLTVGDLRVHTDGTRDFFVQRNQPQLERRLRLDPKGNFFVDAEQLKAGDLTKTFEFYVDTSVDGTHKLHGDHPAQLQYRFEGRDDLEARVQALKQELARLQQQQAELSRLLEEMMHERAPQPQVDRLRLRERLLPRATDRRPEVNREEALLRETHDQLLHAVHAQVDRNVEAKMQESHKALVEALLHAEHTQGIDPRIMEQIHEWIIKHNPDNEARKALDKALVEVRKDHVVEVRDTARQVKDRVIEQKQRVKKERTDKKHKANEGGS